MLLTVAESEYAQKYAESASAHHPVHWEQPLKKYNFVANIMKPQG